MRRRVKAIAESGLAHVTARTGLPPGELRAWATTRKDAAVRRTSVIRGLRIVWPRPGTAVLEPFEVHLAGRGEVTVEVVASAISPGTERAQALRLPHARPPFPFHPGYAAAGRTLYERGGTLASGDPVAVLRAGHASVGTFPADAVVPVPAGVPLEHAALTYPAVISGLGLRWGRLLPTDDLCIVGSGPVGALALRLGRLRCEGRTTVVTASDARVHVARAGGADAVLVTARDADAVSDVAASLVVEATGDPSGINTAVAAAAHGARVVLLGSPRGATVGLPLGEIRRKQLELVGAHVSAGVAERRQTGVDVFRLEADRFLAALASGALDVTDLVEERVDPGDADAFYRRLARDGLLATAVFDWERLPLAERVGSRGLLSPPRRSAHPGRAGRSRPKPQGTLRFGLLGCGDVGVANARGVAAAANASLVACHDPALSLARDLATVVACDVEPTVDALLDRADIDGVLIAVAHDLHEPLAVAALERGLHVIVEKPLAHDLSSATTIVRAADRSNGRLGVSFPFRYERAVAEARELVGEGALGEITGFSITCLLDKAPAYWVGGFSGRSISDWRTLRSRAGGGVLIMNLTHYLDWLRVLTDLEVESVQAVTSPRDAEIEDVSAIAIRLENGAVGTVVGAASARGASVSRFELWGAAGQLVLDDAPRLYTTRRVRGADAGRWTSLSSEPIDVRAEYVSRFAAAILIGQPIDADGSAGLAVQEIVEASYVSARTGRAVRPSELRAGTE